MLSFSRKKNILTEPSSEIFFMSTMKIPAPSPVKKMVVALYCYRFVLLFYTNQVPEIFLLSPLLNNTETHLTSFIISQNDTIVG
jgi:hypothetical protein